MSSVKKIWITPDAEKTIAYCARVSNPANQHNEKYETLLKYCYQNGHWSIFEMAHACMEIETSQAIAKQILRHRSFSFQEFSGRYADYTQLVNFPFEQVQPRRQDVKNRQNSFDDLSAEDQNWFYGKKMDIELKALEAYNEALERGIAKESARFLLPSSLNSRMYMVGSIRSWLHYVQVRTDPATQLEHRLIADQVKEILRAEIPTIISLIS